MLSRNLVIRNVDVLMCTVGLVRPPVSCLGVWSSTVNNDAISRLQICSLRCRIYNAESDIPTAHWNWVGNWSANSSSEHIPNWSFKNISFSCGHNWTESCKHWLRYVPTSHLSSLLFSLMLAVGRHSQSMEMSPEKFSTLTSRDWSKCYSCGRTGHALIHLSKENIKSFLIVIPLVNMSWIYPYMIKSFRVHCTHLLELHVGSSWGYRPSC